VFASGNLIASSMMNSILGQVYYKVKRMKSAYSTHDHPIRDHFLSHLRSHLNVFTAFVLKPWMETLISKLVTGPQGVREIRIPSDFDGKTYSDLFIYMLTKKGYICLGLYAEEGSKAAKDVIKKPINSITGEIRSLRDLLKGSSKDFELSQVTQHCINEVRVLTVSFTLPPTHSQMNSYFQHIIFVKNHRKPLTSDDKAGSESYFISY
jgi:hypothetical protein